MKYDGNFEYEGETIFYLVSDNGSLISSKGNMSRMINFYSKDGNIIGSMCIHGSVEDMQNIGANTAKKYYEEMIQSKG